MSQLLKSGMVGNIRTKAIESGLDPSSSEVIQAVVNAWSNSGLLEGLAGYFKQVVALKLEEAAHIMVNYPDAYNERIETLTFPIIRRILSKLQSADYNTNLGFDVPDDDNWFYETMDRNKKLMELLDTNMVINKIDNAYDSSLKMAKDLSDYPNIDVEAEAAAILSDIICDIHVRSFSGLLLKREKGNVIVVKQKEKVISR